MRSALIVGLSGPVLTDDERRFLAATSPLGIILFARNIDDGPALKRLVVEATTAAATPLVFIDQEGGRVQRIRPPLAPRYPPSALYGELFEADPELGRRAAYLAGHLIASDLLEYGINAPCLPVADVPVPGAHDVIGDRAYAGDPAAVAQLAGAAAEGVLAAGALPVVKHVPGHGRASADSHLSLPTVTASRIDLEADFIPFRALNALPMAMTAHVRYSALDADAPATLSAKVVSIIREEIGFFGLLMTDDISMHALNGPVERDGAQALAAGCDCVLHCNGNLDEMHALAARLPALSTEAAWRLDKALALLVPHNEDVSLLRAEFDALVAQGA